MTRLHAFFSQLLILALFSNISFAAPADWQSIQNSILEKMKASQVSALQLSYVESDGSQYDLNLGTTQINGRNSVTESTRFYSASLTKMLTAIALLQLRENGLVSFDDKIVDHFPFLKNSVAPQMKAVTLKQILSHTSGMARNGEQFWTDSDFIDRGQAPTEREVFTAAMKQRFGVAPGCQLKYSNLGYELLGLLVGKLCKDCKGRTYTSRYEDYIKKHILVPLKMNSSGFNPDRELAKHFATPYKLIDAQGIRKPFSLIQSPGASIGAWGLYSTSKDMLKFVKSLGQIVSRQENLLLKKDASEEVATEVLSDSLNSSFSHSLGFRLIKIVDENKNQGYLIGHTGTFPGFSSAAFYNTLNKSSGVVYFNVVDGGGVGYLMLVTTPTSGITLLAGSPNLKKQEGQEPLTGNPFSGIVKKWYFIYGALEVIYEDNQYFLVQSGQKLPLYLKLSKDKRSLDGYTGTNGGYLDFIGDSITFSLDDQGNSSSAMVANSIHLLSVRE